MEKVETGQVTSDAASIYEEFFLPALFDQFTHVVADAAGITSGQRVLDVACGTGVLARKVAKRVGASGTVVGLDVNEGMLSVAQSKNPAIDWRQGKAESLPFVDNNFDAVVSQFGMMFFEDRRAAVNEMARVLKPGGRLTVAVWDSLDNTPGYAEMVRLIQRLFGDKAANGLRAPYNLGDQGQFKALFDHPQLTDVTVKTHMGAARFASVESWVYTDIKGWVLSDDIDDMQFSRLLHEAGAALKHFVTADGKVEFAAPAHVLSTVKRR